MARAQEIAESIEVDGLPGCLGGIIPGSQPSWISEGRLPAVTSEAARKSGDGTLLAKIGATPPKGGVAKKVARLNRERNFTLAQSAFTSRLTVMR